MHRYSSIDMVDKCIYIVDSFLNDNGKVFHHFIKLILSNNGFRGQVKIIHVFNDCYF